MKDKNYQSLDNIENTPLQAITLPVLLTKDINTTCPYCGVGCGISVSKANETTHAFPVHINGDKRHPANFGKIMH